MRRSSGKPRRRLWPRPGRPAGIPTGVCGGSRGRTSGRASRRGSRGSGQTLPPCGRAASARRPAARCRPGGSPGVGFR